MLTSFEALWRASLGDLLISHPVWSVLHATCFGLLWYTHRRACVMWSNKGFHWSSCFPDLARDASFSKKTTFQKALRIVDSQRLGEIQQNIHPSRGRHLSRFDRSVILIVAVDGLTGIKGLCLNKSQAKRRFFVEGPFDLLLAFSWKCCSEIFGPGGIGIGKAGTSLSQI